jgi:hypothetical protein
MSRAAASLPRSAWKKSASAPIPAISASVSAPFAVSRPTIAARAPSSTARRTMPRPIPELPPVTRTTFPSSLM